MANEPHPKLQKNYIFIYFEMLVKQCISAFFIFIFIHIDISRKS
jgi:hypothetical protein